jgi:hypothetical protein
MEMTLSTKQQKSEEKSESNFRRPRERERAKNAKDVCNSNSVMSQIIINGMKKRARCEAKENKNKNQNEIFIAVDLLRS